MKKVKIPFIRGTSEQARQVAEKEPGRVVWYKDQNSLEWGHVVYATSNPDDWVLWSHWYNDDCPPTPRVALDGLEDTMQVLVEWFNRGGTSAS